MRALKRAVYGEVWEVGHRLGVAHLHASGSGRDPARIRTDALGQVRGIVRFAAASVTRGRLVRVKALTPLSARVLSRAMTPAPRRPSTEVADVILDSMDRMFDQLVKRLAGLTDDEYLWEPVDEAWSARQLPDGSVVVDGAGDREADPAPVTTIAWRLWHIAIDCFDDYTRRFAGDTSDADPTWTLDAAEATSILRDKWAAYRTVVAGRNWWDQLGPDWEYWSQHSIADMAMHASNELVHHAAEIALLRDLYRASVEPPS